MLTDVSARLEAPAARLGPLAVGGIALAACTALALRDPRDEGSYGTCPWLFATGTHCPGCGTLRAVSRLTTGDVAGAAGYNIFTLLALPVVFVAYLRWAFPATLGVALPDVSAVPAKWITGLAGAILSFWVLRNTGVAPFSALAP